MSRLLLLVPLLFLVSAETSPRPAPPEGSRSRAIVILSTDTQSREVQEDWGFSDATAAGDFVFVSGVVAAARPGETGLEPANTRAFDRIAQSLRRLGCNWGDVVEMISFHTDLTTQMPVIVSVKKRYVGAPYPAWTAVGVTRLIPNSGITEIKVTAMCKATRPERPDR